MPVSHLTIAGDWVLCAKPADCELLFHLPDTTPAMVAELPAPFLERLLEAVDPPSSNIGHGSVKVWSDAVGQPHRDFGLPARIDADGSREWWVHGMRHRDNDLPAVITAAGAQEWWQHGRIQRSGGGPTLVLPNGTQAWTDTGSKSATMSGNFRVCSGNKLDRLELPNGSQVWPPFGTALPKYHAVLHLSRRDGGPALIFPDGRTEYWVGDRLHREEGPARHDRYGVPEWWLNGKQVHHDFAADRAT